MKKIMTREEAEKKKQRGIKYLSLIMLGLLALSSIGYAFLSNPSSSGSSSSSNSKVQNIGNQWVTSFGGQSIYFGISPEEALNISSSASFNMNNYANQVVYVSGNDAAYQKISGSIGLYASRLQRACYGNCTENYPEKTCSDKMIVFKQMNESKIYQQDQCVFIEGDLTAVDSFLYRAFGLV